MPVIRVRGTKFFSILNISQYILKREPVLSFRQMGNREACLLEGEHIILQERLAERNPEIIFERAEGIKT